MLYIRLSMNSSPLRRTSSPFRIRLASRCSQIPAQTPIRPTAKKSRKKNAIKAIDQGEKRRGRPSSEPDSMATMGIAKKTRGGRALCSRDGMKIFAFRLLPCTLIFS